LQEGSDPKLVKVDYLYNEKGLQIAHVLDTDDSHNRKS